MLVSSFDRVPYSAKLLEETLYLWLCGGGDEIEEIEEIEKIKEIEEIC